MSYRHRTSGPKQALAGLTAQPVSVTMILERYPRSPAIYGPCPGVGHETVDRDLLQFVLFDLSHLILLIDINFVVRDTSTQQRTEVSQ